ncbi:hypothetical protein BGZ99_006688 [Dissophora globulifera]|uniref:Uncharacterized protein n=1 Tax=Dissophora globulifera TaxID=979702 RepID=A0A9P6RS33_9FUNG|nr:hypothetical protein BGZ99_006688 [Dissophora globulifera]
MVNKPPKPVKAPKVNKRVNKNAPISSFKTEFPEGSLFARSQQFVKENDAKPFRDFGYFVLIVLLFFIWKLYAATRAQSSTGVNIWSFFVFGTIAVINIWTYLLVRVHVLRGGDIGIVRIQADDIIQYTQISGLFGFWIAFVYFGFRSSDPNILTKAMKASVFNAFWLAVIVKFYV